MEGCGELSVSECVVCLQVFGELENVPRVLSCGHSLCESCALKMSTIGKDKERFSFLSCPECNQRTKLPHGGPRGLPKNIELLRLLQTIHKPSSEKQQHSEHERSLDRIANWAKFPLAAPHLLDISVAELSKWVIPQSSVTLAEDSKQLRPGLLLWGEVLLYGNRKPKKAYRATFHPLVSISSSTCTRNLESVENLSYEQKVQNILESLSVQLRMEVFHLFRISILCERVCRIFGLWMRTGHLYLACRLDTQDASNPLEDLKRYKVSSEITPTTLSIPNYPCDSHGQSEQEFNPEFLGYFSKIGMEICELFMELHSEGVVLGFGSPGSIDFDKFNHIHLNMNAILTLRNELVDNLKSQIIAMKSESISNENLNPEESVQQLPMVETQVWHFSSPELLCGFGGLGSFADSHITCKTDAWTLGCLLFGLFYGRSPWNGLSFQEFFQRFVRGKQRADVWLEKKMKQELPSIKMIEVSLKNRLLEFISLMIRCFAHESKDRPDVFEIWLALNCLDCQYDCEHGESFGRDKGISCVEHQANESFWCLATGCLIDETDNFFTKSLNLSVSSLSQIEEVSTTVDEESSGQLQNRINDVENVAEMKVLDRHLDSVTALVICGQYLLSASFDKTICVWSLQNDTHLQTLIGHEHKVMALAADNQLGLCYSGDYGGEICVWNLGTLSSNYVIKWHEHQDWRYTGVASLAVSTDGFLYSGTGDKTVKAWNLQDYSPVAIMEGHKSLVSALIVDGKLLYSGSWDGTIRLWWRDDHSPLATVGDLVQCHIGAVRTLSMASGFLLAGYDSGFIQVWKEEVSLKLVQAHDGVVSTLVAHGNRLFSGSWDCNIKAWAVEELAENPTAVLVENCGSAVSSLVCYEEKLYAGLAEKVVNVLQI